MRAGLYRNILTKRCLHLGLFSIDNLGVFLSGLFPPAGNITRGHSQLRAFVDESITSRDIAR
jgi:hypothetical protein